MGWSFRRRTLEPSAIALLVVMAVSGFALQRARQSVDEQARSNQDRLDLMIEASVEHREVPAHRAEPLTRVGRRQMGDQVALLNRDWSRLLNALVPSEPTTMLLGVDVNPGTSAIRVSGVAITEATANSYAESLEGRSGEVTGVRTLMLERRPEGVGFEVGASWQE